MIKLRRFGLAASLGIDRKEAELYIKTYFELHAGVRKFIDQTIARHSCRTRSLTISLNHPCD